MSFVLKRLKMIFETEHQTAPGFFVDFYFPAEKKVLQVDGSGHFIAHYTGGKLSLVVRPQDVLMDAVLKRLGYTITRRNSSEVNFEYDNAKEDELSEIPDVGDHANDPNFRMPFGFIKQDPDQN
jgi:very-short-patch-repair endonuclease